MKKNIKSFLFYLSERSDVRSKEIEGTNKYSIKSNTFVINFLFAIYITSLSHIVIIQYI